MKQLPLGIRLRDFAVFDSYYAGSNAGAVDHLKNLVAGHREPALWIWGPAATGKTHLLQASCIAAGDQGAESAYLPLAQATEFGAELFEGWGSLRFVCIDDLHFIAGDAEWEQAIFRLFNLLDEQQGTLIVSAESSPAATRLRLKDLTSRLSWGSVFQLHPLSESERIEALKLRARHRGLELPDETGWYLLRRHARDMQSLYNLLDTLDSESLAAQRKLTVPFVKSVLDNGN